ncbi:MAG: hypothetical protein RIK87_11405 [Fuerstiella sp.]
MSSRTRNFCRYAAMSLAAIAVVSVGGVAQANFGPPAVPEIDPSSAASALTVLAGGGLILAERLGFRRK